MHLTHHDDRPYDIAVLSAAATTTRKFEARIAAGRAEGQKVLEAIIDKQPTDRIAQTSALTFGLSDEERPSLLMKILDQEEERVHDNALTQFAERHGAPVGYLKGLLSDGEWGRDLAIRTLNDLARNRERRVLLRSVQSELRGYLTDSFRRLDSRPLVEAFAAACAKVGALPVGGFNSDLRVGLRAIFPEVINAGTDPMLFGLEWRNSDFGVGCHDLRAFVERLWCTNLATRESVLRQVHLGKRLSDDLAFSERTYRLDTATQASALGDVVKANLSREAVMRQAEAINVAADTKVDEKAAKKVLVEKLGKGTAEKALAEFAQNPRVEELPAGPTVWRLSNAVSWLANGERDTEKRIELQEVAGWLLSSAATKGLAAAA